MSDFKTLMDFRKGSYRKFPYQDPTYLSFALLFDFSDVGNSPLLAGGAEAFLTTLSENAGTDSINYKDRLNDLQNFITTLNTINRELPWFWQSIKGVERLQQYNPENAFIGGDDAKLEIETLESLNLTISGLMHLYRRAIFDEKKWVYIMPPNLRKFRMWIYVTEIRSIAINTDVKMNGFNKDDLKSFPDNFKPSVTTTNKNADISGTAGRPYFLLGIKSCEFDIKSGTTIFADLNKNPTMATESLNIIYDALEKVEARVLNGIIEQSYAGTQHAPSPDSETFNPSTKTPLEFAKEKGKGKLDKIYEKAESDLNTLSESKKREALQKLKDETLNRIPKFENVFSNAIRKVDQASSDVMRGKNIGNAIKDNVHGIVPGTTIGQGLNRAAINNLGNIYK